MSRLTRPSGRLFLERGAVGPPYWDDGIPTVIVGTSPSLSGFNFERLRPFHVLAVKAAIFDIPFADAGFGLDWPRYLEWKERFASVPFPVYWAISEDRDKTVEVPVLSSNIILIRRLDPIALSSNPEFINAGGTSGFAALNLALLKRATKIILLGYDYCSNKNDWHYNEHHYEKRRSQNSPCWKVWAGYYDRIKGNLEELGINVVNASPKSWIEAFPKRTIDDALELGLHWLRQEGRSGLRGGAALPDQEMQQRDSS